MTFYGTVSPFVSSQTGAIRKTIRELPKKPKAKRSTSFRKTIGMLPVDSTEEVAEEDMETRSSVTQDQESQDHQELTDASATPFKVLQSRIQSHAVNPL